MRKRRIMMVLLVLLLCLQSTFVLAKTEPKINTNVKVLVNDKTVSSDAPPYIIEESGITMVPLRFISEALGAEINWDPKPKKITIHMESNSIYLTIGQKTAEVNGKKSALEVAPELRNDWTMVPLRFVSESLGAEVKWEAATKTAKIYSSGNNVPDVKPEEPDAGKEPEKKPDPTPVPKPEDPNKVPDTGQVNQDEMRAAWIATVFNIDWPSKPGLDIAKQKREFTDMLDNLKNIGMNSVIVQVRPTSDALYPSKLVPWSKVLTGTQGKDPGYDPLAFMIEETHKRGMEFHAWFNPFRANTDTKVEQLADNHPAKLHPDWVVAHRGLLLFNPGIPEVRAHIIDAIMEVVRNYDIDGVHLDDYFYPYGISDEPFQDDATFAKYNPKKIADKGNWRRDNINQFIQQLSASIKQVKSKIEFGVSPFGIWRNQSDDSTGSKTNGLASYDSLFADTRTWIRNEWIDYVAPQLYWSIGFKVASYDTLVDWWSQEVKNTKVKLYIGHAAHRLGTNSTDWATSDAIIGQLQYNSKRPEVKGSIFFSAKNLISNPVGIREALQTFYNKAN
ncbi:hypothetical protein E0485_12055 [Paenibacillus albiflavus]|uniref:Family 10 glycosylhydrolase n=1 Tax=Paenibacillus albiflavus TaxID=2545760 RepID=A0A4R4ECQ6_9BACL|nr:family 10 glycosylhydrolase [Paenibacillus albiflavus]TCZ77187.1 hypothetical protein E0485_12055 [Paenibacillus albiflavus]